MLRILLISLIIIGCFSNFAHNDWGFQLRGIAEFIIGITFLIEFINGMIKKDLQKTKGDRILMQIERFCIAIFFIAFLLKVLHWPGPGPMYVLSIMIFVIVAVIRLLNLFYREGHTKNQKLAFSLVLIAANILLTCYFHSVMGADPEDPLVIFVLLILLLFIFSSICCSVIILFLLRLIILLIKHDKVSAQKFVFDLFLITTILLSCGILFKVMHWPLGNVMIILGLFNFIVTLIISLTTKATIEGSPVRLFTFISSKFQYARFMFLYFGIWAIYTMLAVYNLAPMFHSNQFPYAYEKLLEAEERDKADKILTNYEALIEEIEAKNESSK